MTKTGSGNQPNELMPALKIASISEMHETEAGAPRDQTDRLVALAMESAELFMTPDGSAWASIETGSHRENWPISSKPFRHWLIEGFYTSTGRAPRSEPLAHAVVTLEARARFCGRYEPVFLRTGEHDGQFYLDLGDAAWRAVEIGQEGWRIVDRPPVRFRRRRGMGALPKPLSGASLGRLRPFLNVANDDDFLLVIAWLVAALRPAGPYPILALAGEPGSAKSTTARILRRLIDPNFAALRAAPRDERDCWITASNTGILALDNLSVIPVWLSDALCRVATGGGFATRALQSDDDEVLFEVTRPIILTAVGDVITQSDLADRALMIELPAIADRRRRDEAALDRAFAEAHPFILGALLDAMVHGLRHAPQSPPFHLPRLADFALWASACEGAFAEEGAVMAALEQNRENTGQTVLEGDAVCAALLRLIEAQGGYWKGRAEDLLVLLRNASESEYRGRSWPANPQALSNRLRLAQPVLRKQGIDICRGKTGGQRYIEIARRTDR